MNWLSRLFGSAASQGGPVAAHSRASPLHYMVDYENPAAVSVIPIQNGFLLARRRYNPNGPDAVTATFVATADEIGPALVADLAAARLSK